ncbi:hypothetical protein ABHI18_008781 [Aspergillus niger]
MGVTYQKMTAIAQFDTIKRGEDEGGVPGPPKAYIWWSRWRLEYL